MHKLSQTTMNHASPHIVWTVVFALSRAWFPLWMTRGSCVHILRIGAVFYESPKTPNWFHLSCVLKIILMKILWNFQGDFWKNLQRITETLNYFIEKLQRNPKEILEIFGALSKICTGHFKVLSGTENTANIFQNNILLVSPRDLIIHTSDSDAGDQSCCNLDTSKYTKH